MLSATGTFLPSAEGKGEIPTVRAVGGYLSKIRGRVVDGVKIVRKPEKGRYGVEWGVVEP